MGTLYIVGTPIGNLEDISLRALRILREVDLIAAEDTRRTRKLLAHYDIHTPMISYFEHSGPARVEGIFRALQEEDKDVALVSEAGMPGLSDPGYKLIREAIARGVPLAVVPGPSAPIAALVLSGLPTDSFIYLGFLPRRSGERKRLLSSLAHEPRTYDPNLDRLHGPRLRRPGLGAAKDAPPHRRWSLGQRRRGRQGLDGIYFIYFFPSPGGGGVSRHGRGDGAGPGRRWITRRT